MPHTPADPSAPPEKTPATRPIVAPETGARPQAATGADGASPGAAAASHAAETLPAILRARLRQLDPSRLDIIDESHLHIGHPGAQGGARHFRVQIASEKFQGLGTVARHRLVYDCVRDLMPHPIHALAIEAHTPSTQGIP